MTWIDEIMSRKGWTGGLGIAEAVGFLAIVHDHFKNDCRLSKIDADELFGAGWQEKAETLKRYGVIRMTIGQRTVSISVICRSDDRRRKSREYSKTYRLRSSGRNAAK